MKAYKKVRYFLTDELEGQRLRTKSRLLLSQYGNDPHENIVAIIAILGKILSSSLLKSPITIRIIGYGQKFLQLTKHSFIETVISDGVRVSKVDHEIYQ